MKTLGAFEVKDKDLAGRIGRILTPRGWLETPALLPVIDPIRQEVSITDIIDVGFTAVITNAYLMWKREKNKANDIHKRLNFEGIVMTDSGAYQILQYGSIDVSQREIVEFQKHINSDIAVILDVPTGWTDNYDKAYLTVQETIRRAREALSYIDPEKRVWTLPIQGGSHLSLLELSAKRSLHLLGPYRLVALGSPTVLLERYEYSLLTDMIYTVRRILPWTVPLHLFGAGHPMIIPFAVALGVDLFDSASYILYARDDRYMTRTRTYRIQELEQLPCNCPVCRRYSIEELKKMPKEERTRLIALHNLYVLSLTIKEVRQAIREGRLWELLEERSGSHPSLRQAFTRFRTIYSNYVTLHAPRVKGGKAKGIFLYGPETLAHPRIMQHNRMLLRRMRTRKTRAVLIPVLDKPFTATKIYRKIKEEDKESHIIGYMLYIGVIPEELAETYPLSQFEANKYPYPEVVKTTAERIARYIVSQGYREIEAIECINHEWTIAIARELARYVHVKKLRSEHC
ncbi:MAG: tRNA guanosine(15) transglycosylase TgtA [Hyperthermus sp.]|nr:MAG: tRNA guanosine(15) transglycosylase TgtA [Hyperthermus sp.]